MATEARVNELIAGNKVMVFSKSYCPFCHKAKAALKPFTTDYGLLEVRDSLFCAFRRRCTVMHGHK